MHIWLNTYKPAASVRVHLLLAATMWTVVGAALSYFGVRWLLAAEHGPYLWLALGVAGAIGLLKSRLALERAAGRMIDRIRSHGDGRCVGGFLSWQTWLFVALMMIMGGLLRGGLLPRPVVGFIYAAIGIALLVAARKLWRAWYDHGGGLRALNK